MDESVRTQELQQSFREEVADLQRTLTGLVSGWLGLVGYAAVFLYPVYGHGLSDEPFWVLVALTLVGLAAFLIHYRSMPLARILIAVGPILCLAWLLRLDVWRPAPYVTPLLALAGFVLGVWPGAVSLLVGTAALVTAPLPGAERLPAVVLLWLTASMAWLAMRGYHMALSWSHNSQMRALQLLGELRARRGELKRTLKGLGEATEHLERLNRELAIARREAEEARNLKEQFVANVSHELRTPLNLVIGFAEMLYLDPEGYDGVRWTPDLVSDIGELYRAAQHLQSLVNDILDLSRIDAARLPMFREMTDLGDVATEALETMAPLLRQHELTYELVCPDDLPEVFVDRTRIRQVLLNLLNNAVRFTRRGGVRVILEHASDTVLVHVRDTGVGIPSDQLESLFERFQQAEAGVRSGSGAGLGLAISKQFVELHGGRIWAESREGEGSTFSFAIPLPGTTVIPSGLRATRIPEPTTKSRPPVIIVDRDPDVAEMLQRYLGDRPVVLVSEQDDLDAQIEAHHPAMLVVNRPPEASLDGWVLVVDDDRGFVSLIQRMLRALDYRGRVIIAYNGEDAVELARSLHPELILLDLMLPGMDGFDVAAACCSMDEERPRVVAVTATSYASKFLQRRGSHFTVTRAGGISTERVVELLTMVLDVVRPDYVSAESAVSSA